MLLENLFSNVEVKAIKETLFKYHIAIPDRFEFSSVNLVVGPNGSGKTRFLRAIKDLYAQDKRRDILYGYFPSLYDCKQTTDENDTELPECTLYDSMYMDDVSFSDFFKEIEAHNEDFIPELLEYHSVRQKDRGEKALNIVKESFFALTGKELIIKKKKIYIKSSKDYVEPLSDALRKLSPGELMLFYMSIFLAIQQNGKTNKVIILDEPESHLHPKALLSFIKLLTKNHQFEEIWIATHSLYIIPEFKFENIVYISESHVQKRASTIYQNVFSDLLGDDEGKVRTFFSSLSQWQFCEFIAECFTTPTVIDTVNPHDEQVQLFIQFLKKYTPLRVLDYGGGSGRLGLSLEAAQIGDAGKIIYEILDKKPTYTGDRIKVYTDVKEANGPYHCVVMMNFLHEVEPTKWQELFSQLYSLMEKNSYLLFVEVMALAQGEMPNSQGFYVLGREELEILFQCPKGLSEIRHKEKQKSSCIIIPRASLLNVHQGTIHQAITHLQERMLKEIKLLRRIGNERKEKMVNSNARQYAFLSQQYLNAKLFLDLEGSLSEEQLKKFINTGKKAEKLAEVMSQIDQLWSHQADTVLSDDVYLNFQDATVFFQKHGAVSKDVLTRCWKYIPILERARAAKDLVALFLVALALMDEPRAEKRILSNGYNKFLSEKLDAY